MAAAAPVPNGPHDATPPWRWRGWGAAIVALALVGGLILRVLSPSPLWLDEALSVNIASLGFGDMVDALRRDGHPALYYVVLGFWIDLFGDSDTAVRLLSGLFSIATVPVVWAVARRHGPGVAGTSAVVALTSPYLLRYGTEARMYALLAFLVALAWLAVERALATPSVPRLVGVAAVTAALIHTHYWAFWVIGAALVVLGWRAWRDPAGRGDAMRVGVAVVAGSATFSLWLGVFLDQLGSTGTPWAARARPAEVAIETIQAIGGNNRFEGELLGVLLTLLVVIGATAATTDGSHLVLSARPGPLHGAVLMVLLTLGIGAGVALVTGGAFEARYAGVVAAFVVVLVARGVVMLPDLARSVALAVVVVYSLGVGVDEMRRDRTQAAEVAAAIEADWAPGDLVVFCPDQLGPATHRALGSATPALAYPRGDGHFVDWRDYADVIAASPAEAFVAEAVRAADGGDIWAVIGLGYKSLGNRCESVVDELQRTHRADHLIAPSEAFERMLLTRYEAHP